MKSLQSRPAALGGLTSYLGGAIGGKISPYIGELTSDIASPVVREAINQSVVNSTVGFTLGTGFSLVNGDDFDTALKNGGQSALLGFGTGVVSGTVNGLKYSYDNNKNPWTGESVTDKPSKPIEKHHFATNKNKKFTPQMKEIADKYGLDLNGEWNIELMPHKGRHPNAYHRWVLSNMQEIANTPGMTQQQFIIEFNLRVVQPVIENPSMLNKNYWKIW